MPSLAIPRNTSRQQISALTAEALRLNGNVTLLGLRGERVQQLHGVTTNLPDGPGYLWQAGGRSEARGWSATSREPEMTRPAADSPHSNPFYDDAADQAYFDRLDADEAPLVRGGVDLDEEFA